MHTGSTRATRVAARLAEIPFQAVGVTLTYMYVFGKVKHKVRTRYALVIELSQPALVLPSYFTTSPLICSQCITLFVILSTSDDELPQVYPNALSD
jgi:ABC-type sulfate transport system permease subunit